MSDKHGMVWWTELMTHDVEAAVKFYSDVCGWTFDTMDMPDGGGTYYIGKLGETPTVGMMNMAAMGCPSDTAPYWFSYFAVDDLDAAIAATKAAGGSVTVDPFVIPGTGRIALLMDPTGAAMGMMTPEPMD